MEQQIENNVNVNEEKNERKKNKMIGLTYLFVALIYFAAILLSNLGQLFEPIYKLVGYKKYNDLFFYLIGSSILIVLFLIIKLVILRKLKVEYPKDKKTLPLYKVAIIYGIVVLLIFIISALCGFEIKFVHDFGERFTMNSVYQEMVKILYRIIALYYAVCMIENFQYSLERLIPIKNEKLKAHLPLGGIATMIVFGLYEILFGLSGSFFMLFFFLYIAYGYLYLYTDRSKRITYIVMIFIMLL